MQHSTLLFASPKQGGILQSSGFLDLKSLMALNLTCKAHAFDELSLIQLIENEITRNHGVRTRAEAIAFLRVVHRRLLLNNRRNTVESIIIPTHEMLSAAATYDVMLAKMLRAIPDSKRLQASLSLLNMEGKTVLHCAAEAGNTDSMRAVLACYPESQRIQAACAQGLNETSALHWAASSCNPEAVKLILDLYPEAQHLQIMMNAKDEFGRTILHYAAYSENSIEDILHLLPESHRLQMLKMKSVDEETALHIAAESGNTESVKAILNVYPESQRLQAVCTPVDYGITVLHCAIESEHTITAILESLQESERWQVVNMRDQDGKTVLDLVDGATRDSIMELLPKSKSASV